MTPRERACGHKNIQSQFNSYGGIIRIRFEGPALCDLSRRYVSTP